METFPRYWPFVRGIHRSPVNSPHKGQWCGALMFSLICAWINRWVNNGEAGDLRRYRAHCDVIVMIYESLCATSSCLWHGWVITFHRVYLSHDSKVIGPTWGPSGADRTQVGPMLAPWILLHVSGIHTGSLHASLQIARVVGTQWMES